jgi:hypothetical protein
MAEEKKVLTQRGKTEDRCRTIRPRRKPKKKPRRLRLLRKSLLIRPSLLSKRPALMNGPRKSRPSPTVRAAMKKEEAKQIKAAEKAKIAGYVQRRC